MKRVLLLVCLIVSLVELDWERDRVYLLSSIASLSLVLCAERMRRQKVQREIMARQTKYDSAVEELRLFGSNSGTSS